MSAYVHTCTSSESQLRFTLECFCMEWRHNSASIFKWSTFSFFSPGKYWSCRGNCTQRLRSGWRWRQSGARWVALTWSSVGTAGPSAEDFFQGRPSLGTWHSSARPDPTSYRSGCHSSAGTSGDNEPTGGWQAPRSHMAGSEMVIFSQFNSIKMSLKKSSIPEGWGFPSASEQNG